MPVGEPIDQPLPLPVTNLDEASCSWLDDALPALAPLGLKYANGTASGCQFGAGDEVVDTRPEIIQVWLASPYDENIDGPTTMEEKIEVAGLPAQRYQFEYGKDEDPTFCTVEVDVRAMAALSVDGFNHRDNPGTDNKGTCEIATKAAEILVRKYVPLAGGTPFRLTAQRPDDERLTGLEPCGLVRNSIFTPVLDDDASTSETDLGSTCTYEDEYGTVRELIAEETHSLDDLPPLLEGSQQSTFSFGGEFPARQEWTDDGCAVAIETGDDTPVLAVTFVNPGPTRVACQTAQRKFGASITDLLPLLEP